jgi:hypothetical protein
MTRTEMTRLASHSTTRSENRDTRDQPTRPANEVSRLWTQAEAADYLHVSRRYLRASACPKILLPGTGTRGKPLIRYDPVDVRTWAEQRRATRRFGP